MNHESFDNAVQRRSQPGQRDCTGIGHGMDSRTTGDLSGYCELYFEVQADWGWVANIRAISSNKTTSVIFLLLPRNRIESGKTLTFTLLRESCQALLRAFRVAAS